MSNVSCSDDGTGTGTQFKTGFNCRGQRRLFRVSNPLQSASPSDLVDSRGEFEQFFLFSFLFNSSRYFLLPLLLKRIDPWTAVACGIGKIKPENPRRHSNKKNSHSKGNGNFVSSFLFHWTAKGSCYSNWVASFSYINWTNNTVVPLSVFLFFFLHIIVFLSSWTIIKLMMDRHEIINRMCSKVPRSAIQLKSILIGCIFVYNKCVTNL
jgi:hypothetical protein